jgi:demethylmenaquinone methyltransferase / 2-methoxy-6-polyprenyl-1,4-benzoquinol methylase
MKGTTPEGTRTEQDAARWVRGMFARVAHRYDLANHLLSFNMDRSWRKATVKRLQPLISQPHARVLDICCGTGDLLLVESQARPAGAVAFGADFCHPMLVSARAKISRRAARAFVLEADALRLPVRDGSFDVVTVAFGLRNLANYNDGLREMRRVLRPGGIAAILEFTEPPNPAFRALYNFYSRRVLPLIGGAITGSRDAYTYLPESVRKFRRAHELAADMRQAGFTGVRCEFLTGGIVALHVGNVPVAA